jgi:thiol-disulfide isomerase/thioredoxin
MAARISAHALSRVALVLLSLGATSVMRAADIGSAAPDFDLPRLGSKAHLRLADLLGKVVLIDFWASWCGPCREALPQYDKLYGEIAHADFDIVAINLDEDVADAKKFLVAHAVRFPVALDPAGTVPKSFGLVGMPTTYLLDRNGVIRLSYQGFKPQDIDTLRTTIGKLAKESAHAP